MKLVHLAIRERLFVRTPGLPKLLFKHGVDLLGVPFSWEGPSAGKAWQCAARCFVQLGEGLLELLLAGVRLGSLRGFFHSLGGDCP